MPARLKYLLLIIIVVLISILIRIIPLDSESITGDELYALEAAKDIFGSGLKQVGYNFAHPPLYYLSLYPIVNYIGDSPFILRLLSLVSGIIIVLAVIFWTSRLTGKPYAGIFGGLLVAISSMQIYYSQDAQSYSLYSLLIFFTAVSLYSAIEKRERRYWLLYSLFLVLSFLTHYVSMVYFLTFGLYVVILRNFKDLKRWFLYSLPAVILLEAWLVYLWRSYTSDIVRFEQLSWIERPGIASLLYLFAGFNGLSHLYKGAAITIVVLVIIISLCTRKLVEVKAWKNNPKMFRSCIFLVATAFLPPVILFLAAQPPLSMKVWLPRHVLPSHIFLIVFIAISIWHIFNDKKRFLIATAIVLIGLQSLGSIEWIQGPQRHPYREIAEYTSNINHNDAPVYTTYYRCPGRVCNYYMNDNEYVLKVPDNLRQLPCEFILIYRPAVTEDSNYFMGLINTGWYEKESLHFGGKWGHRVVKMDYSRIGKTGNIENASKNPCLL